VTLSINPNGGTLGPANALSVTLVGGIAYFNQLSIDVAGTGYELMFTTSVDLISSFVKFTGYTVGVGPIAKLTIEKQPVTEAGGQAFVQQPVIALRDKAGNLAKDDSLTWIRAAIANNPSGGLLSRHEEQTVTVRNTSATHSDFADFSLAFTYGGVTASTGTLRSNMTAQEVESALETLPNINRVMVSRTSTAAPNVVWTVTFTTEPGNVGMLAANMSCAGCRAASGMQVLVEQLTQGCVDGPTCFDMTTTNLFQDLAVRAVNGLASFAGLAIDKIGIGYTLQFTITKIFTGGWAADPTYAQVQGTTDAFGVILSEPTYLRFAVSPGDAWAGGQPFGTQPRLSIQDAGGNVMYTDSSSEVSVSVTHNPTGGAIVGTTTIACERGFANFSDLSITRSGTGYQLNFVTPTGNNLDTTTALEVMKSSEYQVINSNSQPNDRFGWSVSISNVSAVIGAPGVDRSSNEVQTVCTSGKARTLVTEIQTFATAALHRHEVQTITLQAATANASTGGTFTLSWLGRGPSRPIPYNADAKAVQAFMMLDLHGIGQLEVTKSSNEASVTTWSVTFMSNNESYIGCSTTGGTVPEGTACTFPFHYNNETHLECIADRPGHVNPATLERQEWCSTTAVYTDKWGYCICTDHKSDVPEVTADSAGLVGLNLSVATAVPSTLLSGSFVLTSESSSATLPFDANASTVAAALGTMSSKDFFNVSRSLEVLNVTRTRPSPQQGYAWTVTFAASETNYDIPQLGIDGTGLLGHGKAVWAQTVRPGEAPVGSHFVLSFQDHGPSPSIAYDATAAQMQTALEALPTVGKVAVSRTEQDAERGYCWHVTFLQTSSLTKYGFVVDKIGNLRSLVPTFHTLSGTGATVSTTNRFGDAYNREFIEARAGSFGDDAGAAMVFKQNADLESWSQTVTLVANDSDAYDLFGFDVAIDGSLVVVGAPGAEDPGLLEIQTISCTAAAGSFRVAYRAMVTPELPYDISSTALAAQLEALVSIRDIYINPSFDSLCGTLSGPTYNITFRSPRDGNEPLLQLQNTVVTHANGSAGTLLLEDFINGTATVHGETAVGFQAGAAYIFSLEGSNSFAQRMKLLGLRNSKGSEFGWGVDIQSGTIAVTAPGEDDNAGAVYFFTPSSGEAFIYKLKNRLVAVNQSEGDRLGACIEMEGGTAVVSMPGYGAFGAVQVFSRDTTGTWQTGQVLVPPTGQVGGGFGSSVSISGNTVVVGAADESATYALPGSGVLYVFKRPRSDYAFTFTRRLVPTDASPHDRFGASVSIDDHLLLVGARGNVVGRRLTSQRQIQTITTSAKPGATISGTFVVAFRSRDGSPAQPMCYANSRVPCHSAEADYLCTPCSGDPARTPQLVATTRLPHDISPAVFKQTLQGLDTGDVLISRTFADAQGGYTWSVTFLQKDEQQPLFTIASQLTGAGANVKVTALVSAPPKVSGGAYVYTRRDFEDQFLEQAVLEPRAQQRIDLFGNSMQAEKHRAVIGAFNRDSFVPGINAGSAFVYNLGFLNVRLDTLNPSVAEDAEHVVVNASWCSPSCFFPGSSTSQTIRYSTGDINSTSALDFSLLSRNFPFKSGTALGRPACTTGMRATTECWWNSNIYDYDAISDYAPVTGVLNFDTSTSQQGVNVVVTNDRIYEVPDEVLHIRLFIPGMIPSYGGDYWATLKIVDDGDGGIGTSAYTQPLVPPSSNRSSGDRFGGSVCAHGDTAVIGASDFDGSGIARSGAVFVYRRTLGVWSIEQIIISPSPTLNGHFGRSVAVHNSTLIIGADGEMAAYIFERNSVTNTWTQTARLNATEASSPDMSFGGREAVAVYGHYALVGAKGLDKVFVFERLCHASTAAPTVPTGAPTSPTTAPTASPTTSGATFAPSTVPTSAPSASPSTPTTAPTTLVSPCGAVAANANSAYATAGWQLSQVLKPSRYADVTHDGVTYLRSSEFGAAVDIHESTIVVGAPRAFHIDYTAQYGRIRPPTLMEGTGAVYSFFAHTNSSSTFLGAEGERLHFLEHAILRANDSHIGSRFGEAVDIDKDVVVVGASEADQAPPSTWDFEDGKMDGWLTTGTAFDHQPTLGDNPRFRTGYSRKSRVYNETYETAPWTLATQYVEYPNSMPVPFPETNLVERRLSSTKSDCENSCNGQTQPACLGFTQTMSIWGSSTEKADCFLVLDSRHPNVSVNFVTSTAWSLNLKKSAQPVLGRDHVNYTDYVNAESSRAVGNWWVGTYEKRNLVSDVPGSTQGDAPVGTMVSSDFEIRGSTIDFLVGGGCNVKRVYVALVVNGKRVYIATGECKVRMRRVVWDVTQWVGKVARIEVVDNSRTKWGHINFDDVRFSWNPAHEGVENARAGAAYVFRRHFATDFQEVCACLCNQDGCACRNDKWTCRWTQEVKLGTHDRRNGDHLGFSVAVDDATGRIAVGAPNTLSVGQYNTDDGYGEMTGAVYFYVRAVEKRDSTGALLQYPAWGQTTAIKQVSSYASNFVGAHLSRDSYELDHLAQTTQYKYNVVASDQAKIQPSDSKYRHHFGAAVALTDDLVAVGTPLATRASGDIVGSAYLFDAAFNSLFMPNKLVMVTETATDKIVVVPVVRLGSTTTTFHVHFATSDETAIGITDKMWTTCQATALPDRQGATCGDYKKASGTVTFAPGDRERFIMIYIMDDYCREDRIETFRVQLSIPGGPPVVGPLFSTEVQIQDNDLAFRTC
jgi:hypothetical protein